MTLNICEVGHPTHESKMVDTVFGPWRIWVWERYQGHPGFYCTGCDEVSKSIEINKYWERADTNRMLSILNKPGTVLDFGSHIGWFAVQAAAKGCHVEAVDADPETFELLTANAWQWGCEGLINPTVAWVADVKWRWNDHVRFLKCDVEGHEFEVVNLTRHLWQDRMIDYALLEVSPIFENRPTIEAPPYAELVDELIGYGYRATIHKSEGDWEITGKDCTFDQENVLFTKL